MNSLLQKHRPKELSKEKWEEQWNNLAPSLEPLAETISEMKQGLERVHPDDFADANHYAKLVYALAQKQAFEKVMELLPKSIQK